MLVWRLSPMPAFSSVGQIFSRFFIKGLPWKWTTWGLHSAWSGLAQTGHTAEVFIKSPWPHWPVSDPHVKYHSAHLLDTWAKGICGGIGTSLHPPYPTFAILPLTFWSEFSGVDSDSVYSLGSLTTPCKPPQLASSPHPHFPPTHCICVTPHGAGCNYTPGSKD